MLHKANGASLGVKIQSSEDTVEVMGTVPGSAAEASGAFTAGDIIVAINGVAVTSREVMVATLKAAGDVVRFLLRRGTEKSRRVYTFNRANGPLGLKIGTEEGTGVTRIYSVTPGSQAAAFPDILPGDDIVSVNGQALQGLDMNAVYTLLRVEGSLSVVLASNNAPLIEPLSDATPITSPAAPVVPSELVAVEAKLELAQPELQPELPATLTLATNPVHPLTLTRGAVGGFGLKLIGRPNVPGTRVLGAVADTPAAAAGGALRVGHVVVRVNGTYASQLVHSDVIKLLQESPATLVLDLIAADLFDGEREAGLTSSASPASSTSSASSTTAAVGSSATVVSSATDSAVASSSDVPANLTAADLAGAAAFGLDLALVAPNDKAVPRLLVGVVGVAPHSSAAASGLFFPGDVLVRVNGANLYTLPPSAVRAAFAAPQVVLSATLNAFPLLEGPASPVSTTAIAAAATTAATAAATDSTSSTSAPSIPTSASAPSSQTSVTTSRKARVRPPPADVVPQVHVSLTRASPSDSFGLRLTGDDDLTFVDALREGLPAERAGTIVPGDVLVAVGGKSVLGVPHAKVIELLTGVVAVDLVFGAVRRVALATNSPTDAGVDAAAALGLVLVPDATGLRIAAIAPASFAAHATAPSLWVGDRVLAITSVAGVLTPLLGASVSTALAALAAGPGAVSLLVLADASPLPSKVVGGGSEFAPTDLVQAFDVAITRDGNSLGLQLLVVFLLIFL
jgi:C-terminal processing protease CtpA/Prc